MDPIKSILKELKERGKSVGHLQCSTKRYHNLFKDTSSVRVPVETERRQCLWFDRIKDLLK